MSNDGISSFHSLSTFIGWYIGLIARSPITMTNLKHILASRPFYKYSSPDTAIEILRSRNVRYSSPQCFNDPFDIQAGLHFDFDIATLHEKVIDRIGELASASEEPAVSNDDPWGKIVLAARQNYPTQGFPRERWRELSGPAFGTLVDVLRDAQRRYQEHWRSTLLPGIRVFCVSEERDNLLMWAHYAKDHTGCVFEFWALPDEDNPLSVAAPVEYVEFPIPFFTEREWIDNLVSIKKLDHGALYRRYAYAKSSCWSYEKEWRVWYPLSASAGNYDDMPIRPTELKAIYVGCRATTDFANEVVRLASEFFPRANLFRAVKHDTHYSLQYHEM
ncbi:MAG: DUF2971 domain-containing protein [Betaproteobacteria bacterium]|nr:DUF2971 domain-containing protein [Betaproteobacteria bacterium]